MGGDGWLKSMNGTDLAGGGALALLLEIDVLLQDSLRK